MHSGIVEEGTLKPGVALALEVDHERRGAIRRNHSATHLLHEAALRQVLGDHVAQKGSLVAPDRLRFDFSHPKPMSSEEIERVEDIANDVVLQNAPVVTRLLSRDDAIASGARALFGEKYGDEVRVVAMGDSGGNTMGWSVEVCGGTHVARTGDIGIVSVLGESAVGSWRAPHRGVDRKDRARTAPTILRGLAKATASELRVPVEDVPNRVAALLDERKRLERDLHVGGEDEACHGRRRTVRRRRRWHSQRWRHQADGARGRRHRSGRTFRSLADEGKKQVGSGVVAIAGITGDGKAGIVVGVTDDLVSRFSAVDLVRKGAEALGGKWWRAAGPTWRRPAAPMGSKADAALAAIEAALGG